MKKNLCFSAAFLSFLCMNAQPEIDAIKATWYQKNYGKVIQMTDAYYKKNRRSLKLDLIKVSSMCMLGVNVPDPKYCFDYISQAYKIPGDVKDIILKAKSNCNSIDLESVSNYVRTSSNEPPRTVGKIGKSTLQEALARRGDTTRVVKQYSQEALQKRRLKSGATNGVNMFYKRMLDLAGIKKYKVKPFGKFVIVHAALAINNYAEMQSRLADYYRFFIKAYNMREPDDYITIFLAKDIKELQQFAEKLHGFIPPSYTLGYSSLEDQTIVSIAHVPNKPLLGTTCHELFHILSKNTFETLPAWLEEGMASLYEVSEKRGDSIVGLNNWRIDFLLDRPGQRNHQLAGFRLRSMLAMDWDEFNRPDREQEPEQSFHYAYSRYLMLYLQEKNRLAEFFKEASGYSYMDIKAGPVNDYLNMIGRYTGRLSDFDEDFRKWIESKPLPGY